MFLAAALPRTLTLLQRAHSKAFASYGLHYTGVGARVPLRRAQAAINTPRSRTLMAAVPSKTLCTQVVSSGCNAANRKYLQMRAAQSPLPLARM
jgi:hypothetical protein